MTEDKPWRSLPDEDPPERGLAELMALARAKAGVMAHPPWWKRLFDLARRPPVLALATLLVVLGGVIVVRRHSDVEAVRPSPVPGAPSPGEPAIHASGGAMEPPPPAPPSIRAEQVEAIPPSAVRVEGKARLGKPPVDDELAAPDSDPLARCREAAEKKDCATAKACVGDVVRRSPSVHAGDDPALKSCL